MVVISLHYQMEYFKGLIFIAITMTDYFQMQRSFFMSPHLLLLELMCFKIERAYYPLEY